MGGWRTPACKRVHPARAERSSDGPPPVGVAPAEVHPRKHPLQGTAAEGDVSEMARGDMTVRTTNSQTLTKVAKTR